MIHGLLVKSDKPYWLKKHNEHPSHAQKFGSSQRSRCLLLTRGNVGSGDENGEQLKSRCKAHADQMSSRARQLWCGRNWEKKRNCGQRQNKCIVYCCHVTHARQKIMIASLKGNSVGTSVDSPGQRKVGERRSLFCSPVTQAIHVLIYVILYSSPCIFTSERLHS